MIYTLSKHPCSRKVGKGRQYLADNQGNIFDVFGRQRAWAVWRNYHRKPNCHSHYPQVDNIAVSRLVCSAFHGEPKHGQQCHHLNGNIFDNRPDNLIWLFVSRHHHYDRRLKALKTLISNVSIFSRRDFIRFARMSEVSFSAMLAKFSHGKVLDPADEPNRDYDPFIER
jgi:hypothetical protein